MYTDTYVPQVSLNSHYTVHTFTTGVSILTPYSTHYTIHTYYRCVYDKSILTLYRVPIVNILYIHTA